MGFRVADFVQGFGLFAIAVGIFMIFAGVAFSGAARLLFADNGRLHTRDGPGRLGRQHLSLPNRCSAS